MRLTSWTPAPDLASHEVERLNHMLNDVFQGVTPRPHGWTPAVDVFEAAGKGVVFKAELPEMKREDIKVTVDNNVLTIEGERVLSADTPREQYHRLERSYGAFRRAFTLPSTVDASRVQASYTDGVLTISVPHRPEAQPRQITIAG